MSKTSMLTVKLTPDRLEQFRIAAMLRGSTMSAIVQQFVASVVREEMTAVPQAFKRGTVTNSPSDLKNIIIQEDSEPN